MRNGFKVIDADAHFYEPSDIWNNYVKPQYYDSTPPGTQGARQVDFRVRG